MVRIATDDNKLSGDAHTLQVIGSTTQVETDGKVSVTVPGGTGSGTVTSVAAADGSVVVGGTPSVAPTVRTGTLDAIATAHPPVAALAMNGQKITGLANGVAGSDAATVSQIGSGSGTVTSISSANTAIGVASPTTTPVLTLATLDVIAADGPPAAAVAMNSKKITGLANGTAASDAAAFGQILSNPLTTAGDIIIENATPAIARLPIGTTGQCLTVVGGLPAWATGPLQLTPTAVKTTAYNASAGDLVVCNANGTTAVTLPTAPADKTTIGVLIATGTSGVVTTCGGSDVINLAGTTSLTLSTLNEVVILQYAATPAIWYIESIGTTSEAFTAATQTLTNKRVTKRALALSAGSATPAINTDLYDVVHITAQSAAITSFTSSLTGTPVDGDTLRISVTDNGTARALTFGASFEASTVALPTTTVISTRLDIGFFWNTETSKWRCVAVA